MATMNLFECPCRIIGAPVPLTPSSLFISHVAMLRSNATSMDRNSFSKVHDHDIDVIHEEFVRGKPNRCHALQVSVRLVFVIACSLHVIFLIFIVY